MENLDFETYKDIKYIVVLREDVENTCDVCEMKEYCDECIDNEFYMLCHCEFSTKKYVCKRI